MEQFYSFKKIYNNQNTIFLEENIAEYCPDIIHMVEKDDELSVDDSEDEDVNFFEVVPNYKNNILVSNALKNKEVMHTNSDISKNTDSKKVILTEF